MATRKVGKIYKSIKIDVRLSINVMEVLASCIPCVDARIKKNITIKKIKKKIRSSEFLEGDNLSTK